MVIKRDNRVSSKAKARGGPDEVLVERTSPKALASPAKSYVPPTPNPPRATPLSMRSPSSRRNMTTPQSDRSVNPRSPSSSEQLPSRVFFSKNTRNPVPEDDSVTIDSELDPTQSNRSTTPIALMSPPAYHVLTSERGIKKPSPRHRAKLEAWYRKNGKEAQGSSSRLPRREESQSHGHYQPSFGQTLSDVDERTAYTGYSFATGQDLSTVASGDYVESVMYKDGRSEDEDFLKTKQEIALLSISLTSIQLLLICLQFAMCGIAPFEVNPAVGPYPDVFSDWGGKNGYLMLSNNEFWRLISPSALCIGILHLLGNAFCQLEPIAIFEREWGSFRWFLIYIVSAIGSNSLSVYMDPDTIAVGSSGPLMGLFAAKLAQVLTHVTFEVKKANQDDFIRMDQLSSIFCGILILSILAFFNFIDWSGHLGGLLAGFFAGMVLFSTPIRSCCARFFWTLLGLTGLVLFLTACLYLLLTESEPSDDLEDACYYFRNVYHISHECGCMVS